MAMTMAMEMEMEMEWEWEMELEFTGYGETDSGLTFQTDLGETLARNGLANDAAELRNASRSPFRQKAALKPMNQDQHSAPGGPNHKASTVRVRRVQGVHQSKDAKRLTAIRLSHPHREITAIGFSSGPNLPVSMPPPGAALVSTCLARALPSLLVHGATDLVPVEPSSEAAFGTA